VGGDGTVDGVTLSWWKGDLLQRIESDWGPDGTVDLVWRFTYDSAGRLAVWHRDGGDRMKRVYSYYEGSDLVSQADLVIDGVVEESTTNYYDSAGRLTNRVYRGQVLKIMVIRFRNECPYP
jgi:hypothetical protein